MTIKGNKRQRYDLGDLPNPHDVYVDLPEADAQIEASRLKIGDGAFVLRSDGNFRYAEVIAISQSSMDFKASHDGCTKKISKAHYHDRIRFIKREEHLKSSCSTAATCPLSRENSIEFLPGQCEDVDVNRSSGRRKQRRELANKKKSHGPNDTNSSYDDSLVCDGGEAKEEEEEEEPQKRRSARKTNSALTVSGIFKNMFLEPEVAEVKEGCALTNSDSALKTQALINAPNDRAPRRRRATVDSPMTASATFRHAFAHIIISDD